MRQVRVYREILLFLTIWIHNSRGQIIEKSSVTEITKFKLDYTWKIINFRHLAVEAAKELYVYSFVLTSPTAPGMKFRLELYLSGDERSPDGACSLYVRYISGPLNEIYLTFDVALLNDDGEKALTFSMKNHHLKIGDRVGWPNFATKPEILDRNKRLLTYKDELRLFFSFNQNTKANTYEQKCQDIGKDALQKVVQNREKYYLSDKFSDVTLLIGYNKLQAHKIILASASPVFADLLKKDEHKSITMKIEDVKLNVMREVLNYIYTGKTSYNIHKIAVDLLYAADDFQIDSLKDFCIRYLCQNIDKENVHFIVDVAEKVKAKELKKRAMNYMKVNLHSLISSSTFNSIIDADSSCIANALGLKM